MAAGFVYEVLREPAMWAALSGVVGAFLGRRTGRKVIITMKDGSAVHAEGLPPKELAKVLEQAKSMLAKGAVFIELSRALSVMWTWSGGQENHCEVA